MVWICYGWGAAVAAAATTATGDTEEQDTTVPVKRFFLRLIQMLQASFKDLRESMERLTRNSRLRISYRHCGTHGGCTSFCLCTYTLPPSMQARRSAAFAKELCVTLCCWSLWMQILFPGELTCFPNRVSKWASASTSKPSPFVHLWLQHQMLKLLLSSRYSTKETFLPGRENFAFGHQPIHWNCLLFLLLHTAAMELEMTWNSSYAISNSKKLQQAMLCIDSALQGRDIVMDPETGQKFGIPVF